MEVIKAKVLGYCMGVRRAVEAAENALKPDNHARKVYSLGPLIHNPTVLESLKKRGLEILDVERIGEVEEGSLVVIRAHGTSPEVLELLKKRGATVIDATCPRVHSSQNVAAKSVEEERTVIIAGDRNHGEVTGISAFSKNRAIVIETVEEARGINGIQKAVFLSQTTFSQELFAEMEEILKSQIADLKVLHSICPATKERQSALRDLEGKAEGILVIGGKESANTRRLFETAKSICPKTALIEDEGEIPEDFFKLNKVALTAGASTPDSVIERVENKLGGVIKITSL